MYFFICSTKFFCLDKLSKLQCFSLTLDAPYVSFAAAPYWKVIPKSLIYAPGEMVRLDCAAEGTPSPTISWTRNGEEISGQWRHPTEPFSANNFLHFRCTEMRNCLTGTDSRHTVIEKNASLILNTVDFEDTAVYQCRASNKHGTILTNTYVYIIGECSFFTYW